MRHRLQGTDIVDNAAVCGRVANLIVQETSTGVVELPEDDPDIFARFLQYLYSGTYDDGEYPVLDLPEFTTRLSPEEAQKELDKAPGAFMAFKTAVVQLPACRDRTLAAIEADARPDPWSRDETAAESPATETIAALSEAEETNGGVSESESEDPDGDGFEDEETDGDVSEAESEDYEVETDHPVSLFTSLRVYAMADKFDVPGLMLLARHRFYHSATASFETFDEFPAVIDELYDTTSPNDHFMREIPCRLVAAALTFALLDKMEPVMLKHPEFAVSVLKYRTELGSY